MSNLYWGAELPVYAVLNECSLLKILASLLVEFEKKTGTQPQVVQFRRSLRPAFLREVAKRSGVEEAAMQAVSDPVWFGSMPILFNLSNNQDWVILRNNAIGCELSI